MDGKTMSQYFFDWLQIYQIRILVNQQHAFSKAVYELMLQHLMPSPEVIDNELPPDPGQSGDAPSTVLKSYEYFLRCENYYRYKCPLLSTKGIEKKIISLDWSFVNSVPLDEEQLERVYNEENDYKEQVDGITSGFDETQRDEYFKLFAIEQVGGRLLAAQIVRNSMTTKARKRSFVNDRNSYAATKRHKPRKAIYPDG